MFRAHWAKYDQHKKLRDYLLSQDGYMVEASPYDKIWGIGLSANDPRANNPNLWEGLNWLGKILTEIKFSIKNT